ncbi:MAG: hypothetical protein CME15_15310 [Gemmatimonadetes bacterium]|nr:hypothetical protein [Gemmatimonadota bacterium]
MRKLAATIVKRMGVEALELLQSSKVDLVLTDWSMPVVRVDVSSVMCLQSPQTISQGRWQGGPSGRIPHKS